MARRALSRVERAIVRAVGLGAVVVAALLLVLTVARIALLLSAGSVDLASDLRVAAPALERGSAVLLCPTIGPRDTERIAHALQECGLAPIDAPMSGGPARARDGSMSLMVACADAAFENHKPLLDTLSARLFRVGTRCGDGARTKLVNNLLAGINLAGAAEALALAERLGLDPARTLDVIEQSSGQSWIGSERLRRAIAGDYAPRAHVTLLQKDTGLALEAARAAGFAGLLGPVAHEAFDRAVAAGYADLDDAALWRLFRSA